MSPASADGQRPSLVEYAAATLLFAVATWVILFPVFLDPADLVYSPRSPLSRPIARWVMWILAWDTHALFSPSAGLFDANVFHPAPDALAFADPMLGAVPWFAPLYLLTGNPVLAYQATLFLSLVLCGVGMYALCRHWGCGWPAALLAGGVYAFAPARIGVLGELLYVGGQFAPLALLFADRLLQRPRTGAALGFLLFTTWQMYCGTQLAYVFAIAIGGYLLTSLLTSRVERSLAGLAVSLLLLLVAVAAFAALLDPYRDLLARGLYSGRTMYDFAAFGSADGWRSYLVPPYLAALGWSFAGGGLYLGLPALAVAAIGLFSTLRNRARRGVAVRLLGLGVLCAWLSLGPDFYVGPVSLYGVALSQIPGFAMFGPAPSRFALAVMVPVAALVGLGVDRLLPGAMLARRRVAGLFLFALIGAVLVLDYRPPSVHFDRQRVLHAADQLPLYAALGQLPPGPVLELPMSPCADNEADLIIDRQLGSSLHWKPLLDGYRSHDRVPTTYAMVRALADVLPDRRALEMLRRTTGLRYLVVHLNDRRGAWRHRWQQVEGLTRIGFFGHDLLFEVTPPGDGDWSDRLIESAASASSEAETAEKNPLVDLRPDDRAVGIAFTHLPPEMGSAGGRTRAEVMITNRSRTTWPGLTADRARKVFVSYLWTDSEGELVEGDSQAQPLPYDLAPGESVVVPLCVRLPGRPGAMDLAVGVARAESWFPDVSERVRVMVIR